MTEARLVRCAALAFAVLVACTDPPMGDGTEGTGTSGTTRADDPDTTAAASTTTAATTTDGTETTTAATTTDGTETTTGETETTDGPDPICGDGMVEADEECDDGMENGTGGPCKDDCTLDVCGDGYVGPREQCDEGLYNDDQSACTSTCQVAACQDGLVFVGMEECDSNDLQGMTCADLGFTGGDLACSSACGFDTTLCTLCGNGVVDPGEACDGMDLDGTSCTAELGLAFAGFPTCTPDCQLDFSSCSECGNGVLEPGEECEGADLDGQTCATVIADAPNGTLLCWPILCEFNTNLCCISPGEPCFGPGGPDCCAGFCALDLFLCL